MPPERIEQSITDYHRDKSHFSNSDLRHLAVWDRGRVAAWTPHEFYGRISGEIPPEPETRDKRIGSAVHCAVLEPERFDASYILKPDFRTKAGKAFRGRLPHATFLSGEEYETVRNAAQALTDFPLWPLNQGVEPDHVESVVRWHHNNIRLKCRPDTEYPEFDLDIKTTRRRTPYEWSRDCAAFGYHRQAAHYRSGLEALRGFRRPFLFAVVCTLPPYSCWLCRLSEDDLSLGELQNAEIRAHLSECIEHDQWEPEWSRGDVFDLELPHWSHPFEIPSDEDVLVGFDK